MSDPVYSPILSTYAPRNSYLTVAEYLASPTGVDVSQLAVDGNVATNEDALEQEIARASSAIDSYCQKVLAATVDTQAGTYRIRRDGTIMVPLDYTPIVQVNQIQLGWMPQAMVTLPDLSGVWIDRKVITIPPGAVNVGTTVPALGMTSTVGVAGQMFVIVSYVNGWANSLTDATSNVGDTQIVVDSPLGVIPGVPLSVYDPGSTEQIIPLTVVGNTVTLSAPLQYEHAVGVSVSSLPPFVKEAAVLWTSGLIKTRSVEGWVMPAEGAQPSATTKLSDEIDGLIGEAQTLLNPLRRVA